MVKPLLVITVCVAILSGCASRSDTLYEELGGQAKINEIVENFVYEIEYNDTILPYFADTDIDRFMEKFAEQLCVFQAAPAVIRAIPWSRYTAV